MYKSQGEYNCGHVQNREAKQDTSVSYKKTITTDEKSLKTITTYLFLKYSSCLNIYLFQMNNEKTSSISPQTQKLSSTEISFSLERDLSKLNYLEATDASLQLWKQDQNILMPFP